MDSNNLVRLLVNVNPLYKDEFKREFCVWCGMLPSTGRHNPHCTWKFAQAQIELLDQSKLHPGQIILNNYRTGGDEEKKISIWVNDSGGPYTMYKKSTVRDAWHNGALRSNAEQVSGWWGYLNMIAPDTYAVILAWGETSCKIIAETGEKRSTTPQSWWP